MKKYNVSLWPFAGYTLITFCVHAEHEEHALELAVCRAEKECTAVLLLEDDIEDDMEDLYIYVDATMEGASRPYYVDAQNLRIVEA